MYFVVYTQRMSIEAALTFANAEQEVVEKYLYFITHGSGDDVHRR